MPPTPVSVLLAPRGPQQPAPADRDAVRTRDVSPRQRYRISNPLSPVRSAVARESVCGRALPKQLADRPARFAPRPTPLVERIAPGRSRCAPREHRAESLSRYGDALRPPVAHFAHSPGLL